MKDYLLFVKWNTGQIEPVVMGVSESDCVDRLPFAVGDWTLKLGRQVDEWWISRWVGRSDHGHWVCISDYQYSRHYFVDLIGFSRRIENVQ